jgi:hypothetical protein
MEYFKKEPVKGVVNYYSVKEGDGFLVIRCGESWFNVDHGRFLPINLIPITEAEFVEKWMAAMEVFDNYLSRPF